MASVFDYIFNIGVNYTKRQDEQASKKLLICLTDSI